ncbi:MAG TPA: deoxyribonuclease IV [Thermoanaerobaculia bacterium]|nr:deoxyribonuclease IV [Thermoanaerobaculia bacterium]
MPRHLSLASLPLLGAHVSVAGGLPRAFERAEALDCRAIQIFVKNANRWQAPALGDDEAAAFRAAWRASRVGPAIAHASYLINLAARDAAILARSEAALADEMTRCRALGLDGLVVHPGAHLGAGEEAGIASVAAAVDRVLAAVPAGPTRLLLENTAGQGTVLGHRLEHLAAIRARVAAPERVGFALDTCHAFAAGYAIHRRAGYEAFVADVERLLGLPQLGAWHLNDSVREFGSRRDRHAHVGEGRIGERPFGWLLRDRRFAGVPMVIETETDPDLAGHRRDLETLRRLAAEPPRRAPC